MNPLCFVLMPFGQKLATSGLTINFDKIYTELIEPAIVIAGMEPLRADQELSGGIIHKPMFERLILCEFAVADLTTANANVFYELGLRHAVRPASTLLLFAEGTGQLPFDVSLLRALSYKLGRDGSPCSIDISRAAIAARLREARELAKDSPIYQLVDGFPDIQRLKTDVFRDRVKYREDAKVRLATARKQGGGAVKLEEAAFGDIANLEAGVVIDLFLSYRSVEAWKEMIALVEKMSPPLAQSVMVREQLSLALNRDGRGDEAEEILLDVLEKQGPSSETYGILGRVYKDRWEIALNARQEILAQGLLGQAIDAYLKGFEADWRDAYPGINAVTLMELKDPPDPRGQALIPIVNYAVERRIATGKPDYWDLATQLELAVLGKMEAQASVALSRALVIVREKWELETTARNLRLIREARERRGDKQSWSLEIERALNERAI